MHDYAEIRKRKEKDRAKFAELCKPRPHRRKKPKAGARRRKIAKAPAEYFPVHGKTAYQRYLATHHWRKTRTRLLRACGGRCAICGRVADTQVHHKHYKTLWREQNGDLQVLCRECHEVHHLGVTGAELAHLEACAAGE